MNRSMPRATVIPVLGYDDLGEALAWLGNAFGFTLRWRIGNHRAQVNVGDGAIVLSDDGAKRCSVMVRVNDVDAHCERARLAGATIVHGPQTFPYGERQYNVEDFAGHRWTFSQSVADVDPASWGAEIGEL